MFQKKSDHLGIQKKKKSYYHGIWKRWIKPFHSLTDIFQMNKLGDDEAKEVKITGKWSEICIFWMYSVDSRRNVNMKNPLSQRETLCVIWIPKPKKRILHLWRLSLFHTRTMDTTQNLISTRRKIELETYQYEKYNI